MTTATRTETPTAPLPPAASAALARLEQVVPPLELVFTASRYQAATVHYRELAEQGDYDGCLTLGDEMAMCRCELQAAGRLDLIGVVS
ncbi:hypothetical protein [Streptomyces sp. NPDC058108]|uniref:hypothetical protein n=1 Tax=Streptomyces sp. NPDC058108 TaxID=3346344 RepID=UPI0036E3568F